MSEGLGDLITSYEREGAPLSLIAAAHALQTALDMYAQELRAYSEANEARRVIEQGIEPTPTIALADIKRLAKAMVKTRAQIALNVLKNS